MSDALLISLHCPLFFLCVCFFFFFRTYVFLIRVLIVKSTWAIRNGYLFTLIWYQIGTEANSESYYGKRSTHEKLKAIILTNKEESINKCDDSFSGVQGGTNFLDADVNKYIGFKFRWRLWKFSRKNSEACVPKLTVCLGLTKKFCSTRNFVGPNTCSAWKIFLSISE